MTITVLPGIDEAVQDAEQLLDIREMQTGCRLVEDVQRAAGVAPRQLGAELHALRLATTELRRRLAETDVAEPDILKRPHPPQNPRLVLEEHGRFVDGHLEHVGDALAAELHLERFAVVATALAHLAGT